MALRTVTEAGETILVPAIGARARVLAGEVLPRLAVGAVVFAYRAPGPLTDVSPITFQLPGVSGDESASLACSAEPTSSMLGGFRWLQQLLDRRHDMIDRESELLLQGLQWCGRSESVHADDPASPPDVALPAER